MGLDPEDTDISGDPVSQSRPRTQSNIRSGVAGKQNQKQSSPFDAIGGALGQAGQAVQGAASDVGKAAQDEFGRRPDKSVGSDLFGQAQHSLNPIDWAKMAENDAAMTWGLGSRVYHALTGTFDPNGSPYSRSVHQVWEGDSAFNKAAKTILPGLISGALPVATLSQLPQEYNLAQQALAGQVSPEQGQQQMQGIEQQQIQQAPAALATTLSSGVPEGKAAQAAGMLGLPILETLMSSNQDDRSTGFAWIALTGMLMGSGPLSGAARSALSKILPTELPVVEKLAQGLLDKQKVIGRNAVDPAKTKISDWITEQVNRGGQPESYGKPVARALKPGEAERVPAEIGERGEIRVLPSEARKQLKSLLNRVGVDDVDELVHKAQTEGISDPQVIKKIKETWKQLKLPYDLRRYRAEEIPTQDPRQHLEQIGEGNQQSGIRHVAAINHYLDQIHRGLFANHSSPMNSVLRSLAGHNRATQLTHQQYVASAAGVLKEWGLTEPNMAKLMRATEGDAEAYKALPPEAKMVADGWGLIRVASREQGGEGIVANYVPRTDKALEDMQRGRGRPSQAQALAREAQLHREESLQVDPKGHLVLGQRHQYVQDANKALGEARSNLVATLTNPTGKLSKELMNDPKAMEVHRLSATDPQAAVVQAKTLAAQKYADKETNFLKNVNRTMGNQVRSIHTQQALDEFTNMRTRDGKMAAVKPASARQHDEMLQQGYKPIPDARFRGYVFHPDLADNLSRYVQKFREGGLMSAALQAEGQSVKYIMFSPLVHGMNMVHRMGMAAMMHPIQMAHYLTKGGPLSADMWDEHAWQMRSEAYNAGLLPQHGNRSWMDNVISRFQNAVGDVEEQMPRGMQPDTQQARLNQLIQDRPRPMEKVNNYFWGMVNDFGVMMYHLEKTAADRHGLQPEAAMELAARRANSWMGMVAPEDTNPALHDMARLVMFAPNWWRTWAELLVPYYKRAGFTQDPAYMRWAAYTGAKTAAAALAFQKMTGNALNYIATSSTPWAGDGHEQSQNLPGNQDRIEATGSWLNSLPGFSGLTQGDPKTGGRRTVENPLARQTFDFEQAAGLQSGHPDWKPEDTWDGTAKFLVSRAAPIFSSAFGAMNIDLYRTIADHELRAPNPNAPAGSLAPANLLYGAMMMTPMGLSFSNKVQQGIDQGQDNPIESALGTKIPTSLQQAVGDLGDPVRRTLFSWLTGVNPPYEVSQKTRGIKPSDQDYKRALELKSEYNTKMTALSTEALSGQLTPAQWRQAYHDLSQRHSAEMSALYKDSPEYVNGAQGMLHDWEAIYQDPRVQHPDGTVDQDQLARLQTEFRSNYTPDQLQQMDALLHQNDTRYPMLKLYHQSLDAYSQWQQQWAGQNNVDTNALKDEIRSYGQLYGDTQGSRKYLAQHRDLARYEQAKKRQWERTPSGMMYALFYGQNATVVRYLRTHHMTASQFAEQET